MDGLLHVVKTAYSVLAPNNDRILRDMMCGIISDNWTIARQDPDFNSLMEETVHLMKDILSMHEKAHQRTRDKLTAQTALAVKRKAEVDSTAAELSSNKKQLTDMTAAHQKAERNLSSVLNGTSEQSIKTLSGAGLVRGAKMFWKLKDMCKKSWYRYCNIPWEDQVADLVTNTWRIRCIKCQKIRWIEGSHAKVVHCSG